MSSSRAVGAELDPDEFAPAYVGALHFEVLPGVFESLERLRALGLELAVVANWDLSLQPLLGRGRARAVLQDRRARRAEAGA